MPGVQGKSGRKPKTLREKQLIGVKHKARLNRNAPDYVNLRIEKFEGLTELGQKMFDYYEPMLFNNGTISGADVIAFLMLIKKYEDWYDVSNKVLTDGKYIDVKNKDGDIIDKKISPWAKLEKEAFADLLKICREFGLTPVSRGSVDKISRGKKVNRFL